MKVVGIGATVVDVELHVPHHPQPDEKLKAEQTVVSAGGNVTNSLICCARLLRGGSSASEVVLVSKLGGDALARGVVLPELAAEGVLTEHVVLDSAATTPLSMVLVDAAAQTRSCVGTRSLQLADADMQERLPPMPQLLSGAAVLLLDGRHGAVAVSAAQYAHVKGIPVVLDAETSDRPRFWEIFALSDVVVTNAVFPLTEAKLRRESCDDDLLCAMHQLAMTATKNARMLITTRGAKGCLLVFPQEMCSGNSTSTTMPVVKTLAEIDAVLETMTAENAQCKWFDCSIGVMRQGLTFKVLGCTAWKIPAAEVRDTTGAGDAFVGAVAIAVAFGFSPERTLALASYVAAAKCRGLGSHGGVPTRADIPSELLD